MNEGLSGLRLLWGMSLIGLMVILQACGDGYIDVSTQIPRRELPAREGYYTSVSWFNEDEIVFQYHESWYPGAREPQVVIFNLPTEIWRELSLSPAFDCDSHQVVRIEPLPDGNLGLLYDCFIKLVPKYSFLLQTDPLNGNQERLFAYPEYFHPADFIVAPDMRYILQTVNGGMRNNKVYLIDMESTDSIEPLFTDYEHVTSPSWSQTGQVAYFAVEIEREVIPIPLPRDLKIGSIREPSGETVLEGVQFPSSLTWLPDGEALLFSGIYAGEPGIWLFERDSQRLLRLWESIGAFAISPDGQQLLIVQDMLKAAEEDSSSKFIILDLSTFEE